jgi:dTMP kinase
VNRGIFISFEGGEGAGKSTQMALLERHLRSTGESAVALREPGGTEIGEEIRKILKGNSYGSPPTAEVELLLFLASRAQLVRERILPALRAGHIVLCDRYGDSTVAYQCGGRGLGEEDVELLHKFANGGAEPDLTVLLDISPEEGFRRIRSRRNGLADRMEKEPMEFFRRVRASYGRIAAKNPGRVRLVDASLPENAVHDEICSAVTDYVAASRTAINRSSSGEASESVPHADRAGR